jgi:hypothetical protein
MRRYAQPSHRGDESPGVVVLIGADGLFVGAREIRRHRPGRISLTETVCLRDPAIHHQLVPVVHEHMAPLAGQRRMNI